ncbi:MAG: ATP-binding protein [Candidatus Limimorpha sp.]
MRELSLHVYDLLENSIAANATVIELIIKDSLKENIYSFTINDNGRGMSPDFLARVTDPWTTTRSTRKIGIGLPLIKMNSENCGGGMDIQSEPNVGTTLNFWFQHDHIDRPPMGDISGTIVMLSSQYQNIRFIYRHITDVGEYTYDTDEVKEALGGMSMQDITIMKYLREMIDENLKEIKYND